LAAWFIKLCEFIDVPQGFMIGGQNAQGESMANDLSMLMIEVAGELNLVNPAMSFAWNSNTPQKFLNQIIKNYAKGVMHPQLFNDATIIAGLERIGVAHGDAVNYVNCTCTEPTPTGCSNIFVVVCYLNPNRDLLKVIHGGNFQLVQNACNGHQQSVSLYQPQVVPEFENFDEFLDAFFQELAAEIHQQATLQIHAQKARIETFAQPLVSIFMHDCMEKGLDMAWGGGRYNYSYMQFTGFSTLIDSLFTIQELVYKSSTYTLAQLGEILAKNWEDHEDLRQKVVNRLGKWGNDHEEIDALGLIVADKYAQIVEQYQGIFPNSSFHAGYLNWVVHSEQGKELGATPDGRFQHVALSNSFAPSPGVGKEGLTAICNSAVKINQCQAIGACTLNLTLLQSALEREEQQYKFRDVLQTYFLNGGTQVQVNIFDPATLREAQQYPERYPELVVKVGGFSARFIDLDRVLQNEIMCRNGFSL
jgi:formate C-acetyltransferase